MSTEAKRYFNNLNESSHGKLKVQFDFYYLCLIAGFKLKKPVNVSAEKFVDDFPGLFVMQREQIIGLLIATQINRDQIDVTNRERLERLMLKLVKPDSPSHLSPDGEKLMDEYAESGYRFISEAIPTPPANLDTFLIQYYENVLKADKKESPEINKK